MTNDHLTAYGITLGIQLSTYDCQLIRASSYQGETPEHALIDYLDAYEGVYISEEERAKHGT
jgi:hypothetical protein